METITLDKVKEQLAALLDERLPAQEPKAAMRQDAPPLNPKAAADIEAILARLDKQLDAVDKALLGFTPAGGAAAMAQDTASMRQNPIADALTAGDKALPVNAPLVSVAAGGLAGIIGAEVLTGAMPINEGGETNYMNLALHAAAGAGILMFGRKYVGLAAAVAAATPFGIEIMRALLPIDDWVAKVRGLIPQGYNGYVEPVNAGWRQPLGHAEHYAPQGNRLDLPGEPERLSDGASFGNALARFAQQGGR